MKLVLHPVELQLKQTFTTAHGSRDSLNSLIVELQQGVYSGYGEAAAISYYGVGLEKMVDALEQIRPLVESNGDLPPEALWELIYPHLKDHPFAHCALDMARHDLLGKQQQQPLYKIWGLEMAHVPHTSYTIGIDTVEKMLQKMKDFPWPLYKIKLGTKEDVKIVKELRRHTRSLFRVDANGAWTVEETISNSNALKELEVEFIEQPMPKEELEGMKRVFEKAALPIMADESCILEEDIQKCHRHFHGVNIKLAKCGGITPALRMITAATELGMKVMVGCMTESSVGISAIAQLLPLLDYVDMDGAMLLKNDVADGVKITFDKIHFPERNGTGVQLRLA